MRRASFIPLCWHSALLAASFIPLWCHAALLGPVPAGNNAEAALRWVQHMLHIIFQIHGDDGIARIQGSISRTTLSSCFSGIGGAEVASEIGACVDNSYWSCCGANSCCGFTIL